jgi:hypothetical protein
MRASRACPTCEDLESELLRVTARQLKAERDLIDAMFIGEDSLQTHEFNLQTVALHAKRDEILAEFKLHILKEHSGFSGLEIALQ